MEGSQFPRSGAKFDGAARSSNLQLGTAAFYPCDTANFVQIQKAAEFRAVAPFLPPFSEVCHGPASQEAQFDSSDARWLTRDTLFVFANLSSNFVRPKPPSIDV